MHNDSSPRAASGDRSTTQPPAPATPRREATFATTSLDEAAAIFGETYAATRIHDRPNTSKTVLRLGQRMLTPEVRLDDLHFALGFSAEVDPLETYVFTELRSGRTSFNSDGRTRTYGTGNTYLVAAPDRAYWGTIDDVVLSTVSMRPGLLRKVASSSRPGGPAIRFTGHEPVSRQAAQRWRAACGFVRSVVLADAGDELGRLVDSNAAAMLAAVALDTFPNTAVRDATSQDRQDARPQTVRRAVAYIDENASRDISAADIAAAASVSTRALQLAFRRHLDTTPMAYLRRVRLDHARHDLELADDERVTVTAVASRWGFGNAGRFAKQFRETYGATPGEVLHAD